VSGLLLLLLLLSLEGKHFLEQLIAFRSLFQLSKEGQGKIERKQKKLTKKGSKNQ
jgi:hypothetical protein